MASSSSTTTVTTLDELTLLRMQVAQLTQENAVLLKLVPGHSTPAPTTPVPKVRVPGVGVKVEANKYEAVIMTSVVLIMLFLWAFPMLKPFKRHFEHRIHRIFPVITVINLILFGFALDMCNYVQFNDLFFGVVKVVEIVIDNTLRVLIAFCCPRRVSVLVEVQRSHPGDHRRGQSPDGHRRIPRLGDVLVNEEIHARRDVYLEG